MFERELERIINKEFKVVRMRKSALQKIVKYAEISENFFGGREFGCCLIKPKAEKEDIITDVYLPFQSTTYSSVDLRPISEIVKAKELELFGFDAVGEFHYHGIFPAFSSSKDEEIKERARILSASPLKKSCYITLISGKVEGVSKDGEKLSLKIPSNYLEKVELRFAERRTRFDRIKRILKMVGFEFLEDELKDAFMDLKLNLVINYAYYMIMNRAKEWYSEVIYQPVCPGCGPYPISAKRVRMEILEDCKEIDEEDLRRNMEERIVYSTSRIQRRLNELERMPIWSKHL